MRQILSSHDINSPHTPISIAEDADSLPMTYYLDITVRNDWSNSVALMWPQGLTLNQLLIPAQTTRQKIFTKSADFVPEQV